MSANKITISDDDYVIQAAISAYSNEAYTDAKRLTNTGITGSNPEIESNTESFVGQVRWHRPMEANINVASLTDPNEGLRSNFSSDYLTYIKTVRTAGAKKVNLSKVVTQEDGLAKFGRDFANARAEDESSSVMAIIRGVGATELLHGAGTGSGATGMGGQTFENEPTDKKFGFYVDIAGPLVTTAAAGNVGAQRAIGLLEAMGMAFKDYEPEYAYFIASPAVVASFRSAGLVDTDSVMDGNTKMATLFQGKLRIIQSRVTQSFSTAELAKINGGAGVSLNGASIKTSYIVLPGAVAMEPIAVEMPVEIERKAGTYMGGGSTDIWHRWGYVGMPAGYSWGGDDQSFASNADYKGVNNDGSGDYTTLAAATTGLVATRPTFIRKTASALSLGILPLFHS
jgi:hypothetical protein